MDLQTSEGSPSDTMDHQSSGKGPSGTMDLQSSEGNPSDTMHHQSSGKGPSGTMDLQSSEGSPSDTMDHQSSGKGPSGTMDLQSSERNPSDMMHHQSSGKGPSGTMDPQSSDGNPSDMIGHQSSGENPTDKTVLVVNPSGMMEIKVVQECFKSKTNLQFSGNSLSDKSEQKSLWRGATNKSQSFQKGKIQIEKIVLLSLGDSGLTKPLYSVKINKYNTEPPSLKQGKFDEITHQSLEKIHLNKTKPQSLESSSIDKSSSKSSETSTDDSTKPQSLAKSSSDKTDRPFLRKRPSDEIVTLSSGKLLSDETNAPSLAESTYDKTRSPSSRRIQKDKTDIQSLRESSKAKIHLEFLKTAVEEMIKCHLCSRTFANVNQLNAHQRTHNRKKKRSPKSFTKKKPTGREKFKCDICGQGFSDYQRLCGHKGAHISHNLTSFKKYQTQEVQSQLAKTKESTQEVPTPLAKTKESTQEVQSQRAKTKVSTQEVQSQLEKSKESIQENLSLSQLASSMEIIQEVETQPAHSKKPTFIRHTSRQLEYSCEYCNKSFSRFTQLKGHMTVHPTEKPRSLQPYKCTVCKKAFAKSKQKRIHMKKHRNKRQHEELLKMKAALQDMDHSYYKIVPDQSTGKEALPAIERYRRNMKKLKEENNISTPSTDVSQMKVYACQYCEKTYNSQFQLSGHMSAHKRHQCPSCDSVFSTARQLTGHLKVHGGLKKSPVRLPNDSNQSSPSEALRGKPSTSPISLYRKTSDFRVNSKPVTRLACTQSTAVLKRVIKMYLSGMKPKQQRLGKRKSKWFQPKCSLQRAVMKYQQIRMQKILGVLRKAIIMEIEADTHKVVYECSECHNSTFCHKKVLRHYLDKHLQKTEEKKETPPLPPASPSTKKEEERERASTPQRFRNCPICKGSSGFQCHLHNTAEHIDIDSPSNMGKDLYNCDKCEQRFSQHSKLVQHRESHTVKEVLLSCPLCSFKSPSRFAIAAHHKVHKRKEKDTPQAAKPIPQASGPQTSGSEGKIRKGCYNCKVCGKYFYNAQGFRKHSKQHGEKYPFKCAQCASSFQAAEGLWEHIVEAHTSKNPYRCTKCAYSTHSNLSLRHHQKKKHSESRQKKDNWEAYLKEVLHARLQGENIDSPKKSPTDMKTPSQCHNNQSDKTASPKKIISESVSKHKSHRSGRQNWRVPNRKVQ